jgi:hypothetical protein
MKKTDKKTDVQVLPKAAVATTGRPSTYTPEIAQTVLERLANGELLVDICKDDGIPAARTVRGWVLDDREGFAAQYERARMLGCYAMADEIQRIADDTKGDAIVGEDGAVVVNHENVQRARLRVDTRKWLLSKLLPKQFGDRVETQITGPGGGPLQLQAVPFDLSKLTPAELRVMEAMLERAALPAT